MRIRRSQVWLRCVGVVAMVAAIALGAGSAGAAGKGPTDFLKTVRTDLDKILATPVPAAGSKDEAARDAKLRGLVKRLFDYRELGTRSMGTHWAAVKAADQDDFIATLSALIERNYIVGLKNTGTYTITYLSEEIATNQASVKTEITAIPKKKKKPVTVGVEYRLVKEAKGEWRVYDIVTDGDSLVDLYKAEFNKVIATGGFAVLLKKLKDKLAAGSSSSMASGSTDPSATAKP